MQPYGDGAMGDSTGPSGQHKSRSTRRKFLELSALSAAAAAIAAACSRPDTSVAHTGDNPTSTTSPNSAPPPAPTTSETPTDKQTDISLIQSMTSYELLVASFYDQVLGSGTITQASTQDLIRQFQAQHRTSAKVLQDATTKIGAKPYTQVNAYLRDNLTNPAVPTLHTAPQWFAFCGHLEDISASTGVLGAAMFGMASLRQTAMAVGGPSARRSVVFQSLIAPNDPTKWIPTANLTTSDALSQEALIGGAPSSSGGG